MKIIITLFLIFAFTIFYSQKKYYIIFDSQKDEIVYGKHNNKFIIDGIKIFINKNKSIYFIPADKKSDFKSNKIPNLKTIDRSELNNVIIRDNSEKVHKFIIVIKEKNLYNYYFMDHMFRTIVD